MDSTPIATTTPRSDSHSNLCAAGTSFWTCKLGPFIGCCSHDACHDGYCHDMNPEALDHMSLQNSILKRHNEVQSEYEAITLSTATTTATTTVTYTLVRVASSLLEPSSSSSPSSSITPALLAALTPPPRAKASSPNTIKPSSPNKSSSIPSTISTTLGTATTTSTNPTAAPVPGSKKSKRVVAGIALGVIAAVIVTLILTYLLIASRRRRNAAKAKTPFSSTSSAARAVKAKVKAKKKTKKPTYKKKKKADEDDEEEEPETPMTPGGAKLEEQRGRMLKDSQEQKTGYRAVGQTPWNNRNTVRDKSVSDLVPPLPVVVAGGGGEIASSARPVVLTDALPPVHPAYRGRDGQVMSNPGATRRFYGDLNGSASSRSAVQGQSQTESSSTTAPGLGQGTSSNNHNNEKTVHWVPIGHASVDSLVPGPLSLRTGEADGLVTEMKKPRFDETTAKWAAIASPEIGHAMSTPPLAPQQNVTDNGGNVVAMSTENEITSPVDKGGLRKPVKRGVYRGFDDLVSGEGRLK